MPDITLRLNKDMLVLSASQSARLEEQGFDTEKDAPYLAFFESDTLRDLLRMEILAGASCIVANTAALTPARLKHLSCEDKAADFLQASLNILEELHPQHTLVEIGPCGLPLDPASAASLNENRSQYAHAARLLSASRIDAIFLNGFLTCDDLKCALMGTRQVSDLPVFVSVNVRADGVLVSGRGTLTEAVGIMEEYGATVAGFEIAAPLPQVVELTKEVVQACGLPLLVQLQVKEHCKKQGKPTEANPYYCPDVMVEAACALRAAGVQFLRATGASSVAYTGALVAAVDGFDVVSPYIDSKKDAKKENTADNALAGDAQTSVTQTGATTTNITANTTLDEIVSAARAEVAAAFKQGK